VSLGAYTGFIIQVSECLKIGHQAVLEFNFVLTCNSIEVNVLTKNRIQFKSTFRFKFNFLCFRIDGIS